MCVCLCLDVNIRRASRSALILVVGDIQLWRHRRYLSPPFLKLRPRWRLIRLSLRRILRCVFRNFGRVEREEKNRRNDSISWMRRSPFVIFCVKDIPVTFPDVHVTSARTCRGFPIRCSACYGQIHLWMVNSCNAKSALRLRRKVVCGGVFFSSSLLVHKGNPLGKSLEKSRWCETSVWATATATATFGFGQIRSDMKKQNK